MTCKRIQTLLVEHSDGHLAADLRTRVEAHLSACPTCARATQEMTEARSLLGALPPRQTSAQFEARLAARLSQARRPASRIVWWQTLTAAWHLPPPALRPALALGVAALAVIGTLAHSPSAPVPSPAVPPADTALISQCVALHQRDVAAEPLSGSAMQGVAAHQSGWNPDADIGSATEDNL